MYSRGIFFDGQKGGVFIYNQIPVMNYPQYRRMRRLVHECCNYDGGNCFAVFKNVFNDYYAKDTSKKIRAVVKMRGEAGEHIASNPPYGYPLQEYWSGRNIPTVPSILKLIQNLSNSRSGWKTQKKTSGYLKIRSRQSLNGDSGNGCRNCGRTNAGRQKQEGPACSPVCSTVPTAAQS